MKSRALVLAVGLSVLRGNQRKIFTGQARGLGNWQQKEGDGVMESRVDEGTPGHGRRSAMEKGKGVKFCGTCGGSMYVDKKGTFLYRENGWSMYSNNTGTDRADGPGPPLL